MKKIKQIVPVVIFILWGTGCKQKQNDETTINQTKVFAVKTKIIQPDTFIHYFQATGNVLADKYAFITPEISGQVTKLYVSDGDKVSSGQLLAELNASILKGNISEVETQLALAKITFKKQQALWDKKIGSEIQFLQAKTQKEALEKKLQTLNNQLKLYKITAPFSGIVENIAIHEGEQAMPGKQLFELVNLNQMKILADISESHISKIKKGDMIKITFPDYPKKIIYAPVSRTGNIINPSNRTFQVEVKFQNLKGIIKPNMTAILTIKDFESDSALIVPSTIIKDDFEKSFLFVARKEKNKWIAEKRFVETGISYKNNTLITKGLKRGEVVVVEGYNQITNKSELKLVK